MIVRAHLVLVLGLLVSVGGEDMGSPMGVTIFLRGVEPLVVTVSQLSPLQDAVSDFA